MTLLLSSYKQLSQEANETWSDIDQASVDKVIDLTSQLKKLVQQDFSTRQDFELSAVAFFVEMLREEVLIGRNDG